MSDNDDTTNVTEINQQPKGKKTPEQLLKEIQQGFMNAEAAEFKKKAQEKMTEIKKLRTSLKLAETELNKMIEEYNANTSV